MNLAGAKRVVWLVAVALAAAIGCALLALFVFRGTLSSDVGTTLAAAVVYLLPMLALQAATEEVLRRRADASRFPVDWIVYGGGKLALGLVAAAIGSWLALLLGIVATWREL
jgi:hypothetical protein